MASKTVINKAYESGVKYLVFVRDDETNENRYEGFTNRTDALEWIGECVKNGLTPRLWWLPGKGKSCEVKFQTK